LAALMSAPPSATNWKGPYVKRLPDKDQWGNAYVYRAPGQHNPTGYDLSSYGPDGREGSDDIDNWSKR
jgi:general secretion pathway protein G